MVGGELIISLDTDWFYRKGARLVMVFVNRVVVPIETGMIWAYRHVFRANLDVARRGLWADKNVIDGAVNGVAAVVVRWAGSLRKVQTGQLQHYALFMAGSLLVLSLYWLL
jgi:multicomponent Na+:H+ antiporter subunit D